MVIGLNIAVVALNMIVG